MHARVIQLKHMPQMGRRCNDWQFAIFQFFGDHNSAISGRAYEDIQKHCNIMALMKIHIHEAKYHPKAFAAKLQGIKP